MNNKPLVNYDSKSDVLYIVARKGKEEEFVEIAPGINVEIDENGKVIQIFKDVDVKTHSEKILKAFNIKN